MQQRARGGAGRPRAAAERSGVPVIALQLVPSAFGRSRTHPHVRRSAATATRGRSASCSSKNRSSASASSTSTAAAAPRQVSVPAAPGERAIDPTGVKVLALDRLCMWLIGASPVALTSIALVRLSTTGSGARTECGGRRRAPFSVPDSLNGTAAGHLAARTPPYARARVRAPCARAVGNRARCVARDGAAEAQPPCARPARLCCRERVHWPAARRGRPRGLRRVWPRTLHRPRQLARAAPARRRRTRPACSTLGHAVGAHGRARAARASRRARAADANGAPPRARHCAAALLISPPPRRAAPGRAAARPAHPRAVPLARADSAPRSPPAARSPPAQAR
jgi:hypothetical protein